MAKADDIWLALSKLIRANDAERLEAFESSLDFGGTSEEFANAVEAQLRWVKGDLQGALQTLFDAHQKRTLGVHEFLVLGLLELDFGQLDAALEHLKLASKEKTFDARVESGIAGVALARGHDQAAERFLKRSVKIDPEHWHARYLLGTLLEKRFALKAALAAFSRVNQDAPHYEEAWLRRVAVLIVMGRPNDALDIALPVAKKNPTWIRLRVSIVECLKAGGRLDEAIGTLVPIARKVNDPHLVLDLLELLLMRGQVDKAKELVAVAEAFGGRHPRLSFIRGGLAEALGDPEEAIGHYNEALDIDAHFWPAADAMGSILSQDGPLQDLQISEELYQAAITSRERPVRPALNLALVYADWKRFDDAKKLIRDLGRRKDLTSADRLEIKDVLELVKKAEQGLIS